MAILSRSEPLSSKNLRLALVVIAASYSNFNDINRRNESDNPTFISNFCNIPVVLVTVVVVVVVVYVAAIVSIRNSDLSYEVL